MQNEEEMDSYEISKHDQEKITTLQQEAKDKAIWKNELMANTAVQEYFAGFMPSSVESFINTYITYKALWKKYGSFYEQLQEKKDLYWTEQAFEHLAVIQQKKLFDKQCLWRADKLKIPGIEISCDFRLWQYNILNCPFIDPITKEELDVYLQYLHNGNADIDLDGGIGWQNFEAIIEGVETEGEMEDIPLWYQYHNIYTGNDALMRLPDVRGEKEEFYLQLWRDKTNKEAAEKIESTIPKPIADDRPYLMYHTEGLVDWFVKTFENKEIIQCYKGFELGELDNNDTEERIMECVRVLLEANEPVPIAAHDNWIEALFQATDTHELKKLSEMLPQALDQYLFNLSLGIGFAQKKQNWLDIRIMTANGILEGRKLNGEPEDFNF